VSSVMTSLSLPFQYLYSSLFSNSLAFLLTVILISIDNWQPFKIFHYSLQLWFCYLYHLDLLLFYRMFSFFGGRIRNWCLLFRSFLWHDYMIFLLWFMLGILIHFHIQNHVNNPVMDLIWLNCFPLPSCTVA
jgi:hypothetical protein